jgi:hypothetical protein
MSPPVPIIGEKGGHKSFVWAVSATPRSRPPAAEILQALSIEIHGPRGVAAALKIGDVLFHHQIPSAISGNAIHDENLRSDVTLGGHHHQLCSARLDRKEETKGKHRKNPSRYHGTVHNHTARIVASQGDGP